MIVAPATYNTINKWAAGIADTYVLTQLAELTGMRVPTVVLPYVHTALVNRVFMRSVDGLRQDGVTVLLSGGGAIPHVPRTGGAMEAFPWHAALDALDGLRADEKESLNSLGGTLG